jgi:large subunit ribosomal protein L3
MVAALLGKKLGMTRIYDDKGVITPVTVIQAGPCAVMQVKTKESDGYNAVQLGFGEVKPSRRKRPAVGHAKQAKTTVKAFVREVRLNEAPENEVGDTLTVEVFEQVKYVDVVGTTKGRGFTGAVKRYGFKGMPSSHGTERKHRSPGSISVAPGATGRSIKKGKKMAGHKGCARKTTRNHKVVAVDTENNLLLVKGSVAGAGDGYVMLSKAKTKG